MVSASPAASTNVVLLVSAGFITLLFLGIGAAIILSIIPSYLSKQDFTPSGEKYCITNLRLNVTFNSTSPYGSFYSNATNNSYSLSQACYRILQNYKSDSLLSACLISNCSLTSNIVIGNAFVSPNITCTCVIYYSTRCTDQGPYSGVNNTYNSTTNSACRKQRLTNIDAALGSSSSIEYTNVPSITVSNTAVPVKSIYSIMFSNYSQVGAYYCGLASQTTIATAVNSQANG